MKSRHTRYLDAIPGSQFLQLAQGGWILSDIAKHDPKARPVALKVFEKPFGLCAMGAALADKNFEIRDWFAGLDPCPAPQREQDKTDTYRADEPPYALMWTGHDVVLVERAKRRHASDIRQHVRHLLVRQFAAESVHGSE